MMNNDLVARFKEKTDKHWHPFMGSDPIIKKRVTVELFQRFYEFRVSPPQRLAQLRFVGESWTEEDKKYVFNSALHHVLSSHSMQTHKWIVQDSNIYEFKWWPKDPDIKGDG